MQDKLIGYHKDIVKKYTHKLEYLDETNQAYSMVKEKLKQNSESNYMLFI